MVQIKGSEMCLKLQREALAMFVHRFTKDHIPQWARIPRDNGKFYPVQFASDQDWLEHTMFWINKDGSLSRKRNYCQSSPTWPKANEGEK